MRDRGGDLARYYPSLEEEPLVEGLEGAFTEYVLSNEAEIVEIGSARYTQTNECRRCVALLAGIWETSLTRFHLVDLGTSAGLNLLLDRYRYSWGEAEWGALSPVGLTTQNRGRDIKPRDIEILSRTGLDLHPVDPTDPDDARWLEALIWPEQHDRRRRLQAALRLVGQGPPSLIAGDATETLPRILFSLPAGEPALVLNSFFLNQLSRSDRDEITAIVENERRVRPMARVSLEWLRQEDEAPTIYVDDGHGLELVGSAHPHGEWVELYALP